MTYINSVLFTNIYQYSKVFQCDISTFIYTNSLTNNCCKLIMLYPFFQIYLTNIFIKKLFLLLQTNFS